MKIIFSGDLFFKNVSHANINRNVVLALSALGHEIKINNIEDMGNFDRNNLDHVRVKELTKTNIGLTDFNIAKLHSLSFLKKASKFNCVLHSDGMYTLPVRIKQLLDKYPVTHLWLPTPELADHINKEVDYEVVGMGVDTGINPTYFNTNLKPYNYNNKKFKFMIACDGVRGTSDFPYGGFRGTDIAIDAFLQEFKNDENVCLICKIGKKGKWENQYVCGAKEKYGSSLEIIIDSEFTDHNKIGGNWISADCMLSPIRDCRWEACVLEALACGVPLIATDCGGPKMWGKKGVYHIPFITIPAKHGKGDTVSKDIWTIPDINLFSRKMRWVYEHKQEARKFGLEGSQYILENWKWENIAKRIVKFFKEEA